MALPFYRLQKAPVTVLLIYQREKDALLCPLPLAVIIRTSLFSEGPRLIFKKCVSIDVTVGRVFCQVPASSTAKVPWLGRAFIKPHLIKESVILSVFASVLQHMVSISGIKMANTCSLPSFEPFREASFLTGGRMGNFFCLFVCFVFDFFWM